MTHDQPMLDSQPADVAVVEAPSNDRPPSATPANGVVSDHDVRRRRRRRRLLGGVGAGLLVVAVFSAGVGVDRTVLQTGAPAATSRPAEDANLALVQQAWDLLHEKYVGAGSLDSKKLAYAAIEGMTEAVGDTGHTSFLTPDELAAAQAGLSGSYAGIGAEMDTSGDEPVVVGVFRGSPAAGVGLRSGDVVTAVDGTPTKGRPLDVVVSSVRGPAGSSVTLTIRRPGTAALLTLRIVRADVQIVAVEWATVPGTAIADIRVEQFSSGAGKALRAALTAALATDPGGVILDLRGDPGGYVNEAVDVASEFLSSGDVYVSRDATGATDPTAITAGGLAPAVPLVVLVDRGTASAAEIVTGALEDAGRATVVGVRTFGTGTVLGTFSLADGSALRIGTVEWLTPKGRVIWHEGLAPDVTVALPDGVVPVTPDDLAGLGAQGVAASPDAQLLRAIAILRSDAG